MRWQLREYRLISYTNHKFLVKNLFSMRWITNELPITYK